MLESRGGAGKVRISKKEWAVTFEWKVRESRETTARIELGEIRASINAKIAFRQADREIETRQKLGSLLQSKGQ